MDDTELLIWDSNKSPPTITGSLILWQSYFELQDDDIYSIPKLLESKAEKFRAQYLAFIYDLGETKLEGKRVIDHLEIDSGFSYWWMTLITEKCNFSKSPQIDNILKLMAFRDWFERSNYKSIKLVTSNDLLASAITFLSKELDFDFQYEKIKKKHIRLSPMRSLYRVLPYSLQAITWLVHNIVSHWSLKGVGIDEWKHTKAKVTLVSYLFNLNSDLSKKGQFGSQYWTLLPDMLTDEKVQTNWLHIYVKDKILPNAKAAKKMINKFNSYHDDQVHVTLYSFLSLPLVIDALKTWFTLLNLEVILMGVLQEKAGCYWSLIKHDYENSMAGQAAISSILSFYLFQKAMSDLPKQDRGVYLQENQGWEIGFIHAWRSANHSRCLIGMPHTPTKFWDLRSHFDPRSYSSRDNDLPMPDYIGVNGDAAKNLYCDAGCPSEILVDVEALRYLYLAPEEKIINGEATSEANKTLLILGDYIQQNTFEQIDLLNNASKLMKDEINLLVKPHPACPINSEDYPDLNLVITDEPISALIDCCALVYTSNTTSAAVDAYCSGKLVITFLDSSSLNLSPLNGSEGVNFVSTAKELASVLNNIGRIKVNDKQGENFFYLNSKLPKWKSLLVDDNSEVVELSS